MRSRLLAALGLCHLLILSPLRAAEEPGAIVFFGDSLTAGYGLNQPEVDAYPALVQRKIDAEGLPYRVINAGLSGDTTAAGLRRVDWTLRQAPAVFVLALGANDGLRGVPPAATLENLRAILTRVRAAYPDAKLVVAGMMMPATMGTAFTEPFREAFPTVAEEFGATLIPFLLEDVGGVREFNQGDGIHPNVRGHERVAENVWKVLEPLLAEKPAGAVVER